MLHTLTHNVIDSSNDYRHTAKLAMKMISADVSPLKAGGQRSRNWYSVFLGLAIGELSWHEQLVKMVF